MQFNNLNASFINLTRESTILDDLLRRNDEYADIAETGKDAIRAHFSGFIQAILSNVYIMSPSLMRNIRDGIIDGFNKRMRDGCRAWLPITDIDGVDGLNIEDRILKIDTHSDFRYFVKHNLFGNSSLEAFGVYINKHLDHFKKIRQVLDRNAKLISELWDGRIAETKISFEVMGADQHGYFPPTAITLEHNDKTKKLIYKSRLGHSDCLVTELFREINDKTGSNILPYYNQKVLDNEHLLSEFISGALVTTFTPDDPQTGAGNVVEKFIMPPAFQSGARLPEVLEKKKSELSDRIATLDYVAKQIGLTDLHGDNAIYDSESNFVVPIDLEAFDSDKATGLFGHEEHETRLAPADEQHKEIIDGIIKSYMQKIEVSERRLVPVETAKLYESVSGGIEATFILLKKALEEKFEVDSSNLTDYVTRCVKREEKLIPAFTLSQGTLYGAPIDGEKIIVARQKK
ncbi:MAG TPA: hypothetical protein VJ810_29415 [Blastocatellia bacterium]|nr:hypothetical protein [Blastocatellia bacterium]